MPRFEQLMLEVPIREKMPVLFYHGEEYISGGWFRRRLGLGKRAVRVQGKITSDDPFGIETATIDAGDITPENFKDADLRYALRFAAAAEALGWVEDYPGLSYRNSVYIVASNEGANSRLLRAHYSGNDNHPFLDDFKSLGKL